ncbi:MAG: glycerol-3-phosphate dehydrogenase C-terminal domain-containing protein, partial [Thermomicrobiales bacterium]
VPDRLFTGAPANTADHLRRVYGNRAADVLDLATTPDLREPFDPWTGAIGAEVIHAVRREAARTLADILARRSMVGLGPDLGIGPDEAAAAIAVRHLGWSDERAAREVAEYRAGVARYRPRILESAAHAGAQSPTPAG